MEISEIVSAAMVFVGAALLADALSQGHRIRREVSRGLAATWGLTLLLLVFFLAGYLLFAFLMLSGVSFPLELITGVVFLGGACYVVLIMRLSHITFHDLRQEFHDRLEAREELRRSEGRFRTIVEAIPDAMLRISSEGACRDFLGEREQLASALGGGVAGRGVAEIFPGDVAESVMLHVGRALVSGEVQVFEFSLPLDGGGEADYEARVMRCDREEVIALVRDVSSRRRAERALEVAKENLERQNADLKKIDRVKDALISDVSHELKTPVAKQAMQLEVLRKVLGGSDLPGRVRDVVDTMERCLKRQQSVIRNILTISRLETGGRRPRLEPVRLDRVVEEVLEEYGHSLAVLGISLRREMQAVTVRADGEMLWNVFSNLVDNAVKYRGAEDPAIGVSMEARGGEAVVHISDNGVGLAPGESEKVFERFYQGATSSSGIGLGLSIARLIVERFGGTIALRSEGRGKGVTATVTLPLCLPG